MKKLMMTLAAVLCCAMTTTVLSSCNSRDDNPVVAGSESWEFNFGYGVEKPYLQFGASLSDVEKYMHENYPDWTIKGSETLSSFDSGSAILWDRCYSKDNREISFSFSNAEGANLAMVSYDFFFPTDLPPIMAELESKGLTREGMLKFDDYNADLNLLYLSADKKLEVQLGYWKKDGGSWNVSFLPLDKEDLKVLVPLPTVAMSEVVTLHTVPQSIYQLGSKELQPIYVVVNSAYKDAEGKEQFYDLATITSVKLNPIADTNQFTIDASQLIAHGYIKLIPNMANQDVKDFVEDMEFAQLSGSLSCPLVLTNCFGETLETSVDASYATWVYPTEVDVKKEIKLADLDEDGGYTMELPDELKLYKLFSWPFSRYGDTCINNCDNGLWSAKFTEDGKLYIPTDGAPSDAGLPGTLQFTFKRYLQGSPYLMPFSESEGLLVNFQLNLELNITE